MYTEQERMHVAAAGGNQKKEYYYLLKTFIGQGPLAWKLKGVKF